MFCKKCGNQIDSSKPFCSKCGNSIEVTNVSNTATSIKSPATYESNDGAIKQITEKVTNHKLIIPIAASVLVVFIIAISVWFFMSLKGDVKLQIAEINATINTFSNDIGKSYDLSSIVVNGNSFDFSSLVSHFEKPKYAEGMFMIIGSNMASGTLLDKTVKKIAAEDGGNLPIIGGWISSYSESETRKDIFFNANAWRNFFNVSATLVDVQIKAKGVADVIIRVDYSINYSVFDESWVLPYLTGDATLKNEYFSEEVTVELRKNISIGRWLIPNEFFDEIQFDGANFLSKIKNL